MQNKGFTLLEVSVVLVIIGLVAGGTLAARELIAASQIRSSIRQYQEFNSAVSTFRNKFDCLPGDCTHVADVGFNAGSEGNGDGVIGECSSELTNLPCSYSYASGTAYKESFYVWYHLSAVGMINTPIAYNATPTLVSSNYMPLGSETPMAKTKAVLVPAGIAITSSGWGIQGDVIFDAAGGAESIYTHSFVLAATVQVGAGSPGATNNDMGSFRPATLYGYDSKLDDGLPLSGGVRVWQGMDMNNGDQQKKFVMVNGVGNQGAAVCVSNNTGGNYYNVAYDGTTATGFCNLLIQGGF